MGGTSSINLPESKPPPPRETDEMKADVYKMFDQIKSMKILDTLRVGRVSDEDKSKLEKIFPEFIFLTGPRKLTGVTRNKYDAADDFCYSDFRNTHYWEFIDNNGTKKRSFDYRPGSTLFSCDPDKWDNGSYDDRLLDVCIRGTNHSLCKQWLNLILLKNGEHRSAIDSLNKRCSSNADTPLCESWIRSMRMIGGEQNATTIDNILENQSREFKDKYMKCSYPSDDKLNEALKYNEPRECWDPDCANANVNFLLNENYRNLGLCKIVRCNVNVDELSMDQKSKLRMSCRTKDVDLLSTSPVNKLKVIEYNVDHSFNLKMPVLVVLIFLVIWILIVSI